MIKLDQRLGRIEELEWDSLFFGRRIGKIALNNDQDLEGLDQTLSRAQLHDYRLIYVFAYPSIVLPISFFKKFDSQLVDTKVVYTQRLSDVLSSESFATIHSFNSADTPSELYNLAFESGQHSRYRVDPFFSEQDFQRLYREWIDNSILGIIADKVFLYKLDEKVLGMVTLKMVGDKGTIGLMAVEDAYRGQGIGKTLMNYIKKLLVSKEIKQLEVATQKANRAACLFYEKNGFTVASETDIYHVWL
ncbi:GNAT family N-acetyltransferase [Runella salmonicolor]|uniref:GNAT family N-acetyltransferase n=1 Tax=Runella salmonicolor TaxID=2950278 RepID=A0ABT1FHG1_9BACT|nr:GNAT family N-acetyltransferase [Runella salmonicolor]MCP1381201.1 GNAT family N-acetyltransferase [Runella salmonicolor]